MPYYMTFQWVARILLSPWLIFIQPRNKQSSRSRNERNRKKTRCFQARILVKENHAFLQCLGRGFKQGDIAGVVQRSQTEKCSAAQHRTGQDLPGQDRTGLWASWDLQQALEVPLATGAYS
ncbi:predicted protein [Histoplasma capsulatum H143]|uniref:Uncharacterized protein n=1 Tax=Ajellomyces capsulatus (strain H143) TaxID=544712 RepID=C6HR16_AJECH|nr:predicted protein [Histoplasma capsulatum H143]